MVELKAGMVVEGGAYNGFHILSVAKNGWCKGYYPSNVREGNIDNATAKVRSSWMYNECKLIC